jgi:hypothetical protein
MVEAMLKKEKTHAQWDKHAICFVVLGSQIIINVFRGSKANPSVIGVEHCGVVDWLLFSLYLIICVLASIYSIRRII